ncbi:MAG: hypothetical protein CMO01_10385 [Thalassobius sp.]|nr:hypothetical protein [Thalassovita sp.]
MEPTLEAFIFTKLESNSNLFFDILPDEWSNDIVPVWSQYEKSSSIYVVKLKGKIIGGGILFNTPAPDTKHYNALAISKLNTWFDKGYKYIAYFLIQDQYRGMGIGLKWLMEIIALQLNQGLFLTVDEQSLINFYEKVGFKLQEEIRLKDCKEWVLVWG